MLQDADLIFVEYTTNDLHAIRGEVEAALDNPKRRGTERLLRRLLTFEKRPAVVVLHTWAPKVRSCSAPDGPCWLARMNTVQVSTQATAFCQ